MMLRYCLRNTSSAEYEQMLAPDFGAEDVWNQEK